MFSLIAIKEIEKKVEAIINSAVRQMGFEIIRIRYIEKEHPALQIMIDRNSSGVQVDECAKVSTTISTILDVNDPIDVRYDLEVSSPGINRPLTRKKDFEIWKSYTAKIKTFEFIDRRKTFSGILQGLQNDEVLLEVKEGTIGLHLEWINEAYLTVSIEKILKDTKRKKSSFINESHFDEIVIDRR